MFPATGIYTTARMRVWRPVAALTLMAGCGLGAAAQGTPAQPDSAAKMSRTERADRRLTAPVTAFYLKNVSQPNDGNEILTGLRLMLDPGIKVYLVVSQNTILMQALPEEIAVAGKLIDELDKPRRKFRLTYIVVEMDGGKTVGTERYTLALLDGQRVTLKQGSKIPVQTGRYEKSSEAVEAQMTYLDVGVNFDSTVTATAEGGMLRSKVEQSAVMLEDKASLPRHPVVRQVVMEGASMLTEGKTTPLGILDVPGSTRRLEIEALLERVP
jgi:type II secretory pathway component GspD/PulD (secretin)